MAISPEMIQQLIAQFQGQGLGDPTGILPASGIPQPVPLSGLPLGASGLGFPGETLMAGLGGGMGGGPMGQIPTPSPEYGGPPPMMGPIGAGALGQGGYGGFGGGFGQGPAGPSQEVPGAAATTSGDILGQLQQGLGAGKDLYSLYQKFFSNQTAYGVNPTTGAIEQGAPSPTNIQGQFNPQSLQGMTAQWPEIAAMAGQAVPGGLTGIPPGATFTGATLAPAGAELLPQLGAYGFGEFAGYPSALGLGGGGAGAAGTGTAAGAGGAAAGAGAGAGAATAGAYGTGAGTGMALGLGAAAAPFLISDLASMFGGGPSTYEIFSQTGGPSQAQRQAREQQNAQMVQGRFLQDVTGATDLNQLANILENAQLGRYEGQTLGGYRNVGGSPLPVVISNMVRGLAPEQMTLPPELVRAFDPGVGTWASLGHPNMDRTVTSPRTFFETILQDPSRFNIAMQSGTDVGGINDLLRQVTLAQIQQLAGTLPGTSPDIPQSLFSMPKGTLPSTYEYRDSPIARGFVGQGYTPQQAMAMAAAQGQSQDEIRWREMAQAGIPGGQYYLPGPEFGPQDPWAGLTSGGI